MNDKVIRLQARMRHKNDTYSPPLKEEILKMREPSKKEDTPKKIFLNIDGHGLINVDDISYVGIEKGIAMRSSEEIAKDTDLNEKIRSKIVYSVKIRSSSGFILWSSDIGDKVEIAHLYYRIHEILKKYGITTQYVEFEPSNSDCKRRNFMMFIEEAMPGTTFLSIRNRLILNVNEILTIAIVKEKEDEYFVQAHMKTGVIENLHSAFDSMEKAENFYIEVQNALFDLDTVRMIGI